MASTQACPGRSRSDSIGPGRSPGSSPYVALLVLLHMSRPCTGRDAVYLACMDSRALPGIIGNGQLPQQHDRDYLQLLVEMHPEAFPRLDQVVVEGAQHAQAHVVGHIPLAV